MFIVENLLKGSKNSDESVYNSILNQLKPGSKWSFEETDKYETQSEKIWP